MITLCLSNVFLPILSDGVHEEPIDFMYSSVYSGAVALKKLALEYTKGGSMALTDKAIQGLKPRGTRYLVTDGRGLCLEILPSGHLSWLYRYRFKGKLEKVAIGSYPEMSLKVGRRERDRLATLLASGQSPAQKKRPAKAALASLSTMREFAERYYREVVVKHRKDPTDLRR